MNLFESYSIEHLLPVLAFGIAGALSIRHALPFDDGYRRRLGTGLAILVMGMVLGGIAVKLAQGTFDIMDDLPLYLCRLIALVLPFAMWNASRYWLGIFYFWILAGTLQGILTPDLKEGFPSFFYFRYWFLHAGLVMTIVYAVWVYRIRITWRDFWRAIIWTQVYIAAIHGLNMLIGSNYSFTMRKPESGSILDILGPWPLYLITGQVLIVTLFLLLMLPWILRKKAQSSHH